MMIMMVMVIYMVMMRILNCCYFILLSLRHVTHDFSSGGYDASTNFKRIEAPKVGIQFQQRGNVLVLLTWSSIKTYQSYISTQRILCSTSRLLKEWQSVLEQAQLRRVEKSIGEIRIDCRPPAANHIAFREQAAAEESAGCTR